MNHEVHHLITLPMNPIYLGLIRHLLTMGAGALASNGVISSNQTEIVVGSAIGIVGVIWSVIDKKRAAKKLEDALH
jgi:hypothetical protein